MDFTGRRFFFFNAKYSAPFIGLFSLLLDLGIFWECVLPTKNSPSYYKSVLFTVNSTYHCCQQPSKKNVLDCVSTHVKPTTFPVHFGSREKGRRKSILCTSYNSWFLLLKEHPIRIPHWVFHPLCTAANLCPTRLEVIQLTKTFQSARVFLGVALLTGLNRRVGTIKKGFLI